MTKGEPPLSREEHLRRVCLVALTFARNVAYYRAARNANAKYAGRGGNYGITVDGNFIDIATLEWCKLFGDAKAVHGWNNVVSDLVKFEAELLAHIGLKATEFADLVKVVRTYRDKFVAHLDKDRTMIPPKLDHMWSAIRFYFNHVLTVEMTPQQADKVRAELKANKLPDNICDYFDQSFREARAVYGKA